MNKLVLLIIAFLMSFSLMAKDFAWLCAVEWTEKKPEWVFVYEDVKLQSDGNYRIYVKWDFPINKEEAKQVWLISADFDRTFVVSSVGYNSEGLVVYKQEYPYGSEWSYVLSDTYAEAIIEKTKEILLK